MSIFEQLNSTVGELGLEQDQASKLTELVTKAESDYTEIKSNLERTQTKANDIISNRDKLKEKYHKVLDTVGLPTEWDDDALNGVVEKIRGQEGDREAEIRAEMADRLERQKLQYEEEKSTLTEQLTERSNMLEQVAFSKEVSELLSKEKEIDPTAHRFVEYDLRSLPHRFDPESNRVVYLDKEGQPKLNPKGSPYGVEDYYSDLKEKGQFDALIGVAVRGSDKTSNAKSPLNDPNASKQDLFAAGVKKLRQGR